MTFLFHDFSNEDICQDSTVISLNTKYSNKRTKFRIAGAVQRETPQEVEQTHQVGVPS